MTIPNDFLLSFISRSALEKSTLPKFLHLKSKIKSALAKLKSHKQAEIFLTKVSKRDAPDYYDVIKNPIDLGYMSKKTYESWEDFMADLELMWDNCLFYNTAIYYRNCAYAMREIAHGLDKNRVERDVDAFVEDWIGDHSATIEECDKGYALVEENSVSIENKSRDISDDRKHVSDNKELSVKSESIISPYNVQGDETIVGDDALARFTTNVERIEDINNRTNESILYSKHSKKVQGKHCFCKKRGYYYKHELDRYICSILLEVGYVRLSKNALNVFRDVIGHKLYGLFSKHT